MSSTNRVLLYGLTIVIVFVIASISVPQKEVQASAVPQEEVLASPAITLGHDCSCTYSCQGDLDNDGDVDDDDNNLLLAAWGCLCEFRLPDDPTCGGTGCMPGDLNDDGVVNVDDLIILLANWGRCP